MRVPDFILIADRGVLKAFQVETPGGREPMPRLLDIVEIEEAHFKFQNEYADQAGGFPNEGKGGMREGNSAAERMNILNENESRILHKLAKHITALLAEHEPTRWAFAAPAAINRAVLDLLDQTAKSMLALNIEKDLVKIPQPKLLAHFENA